MRIEIDVVTQVRRMARKAGPMRTSSYHVDRKKEARRQECRRWTAREKEG